MALAEVAPKRVTDSVEARRREIQLRRIDSRGSLPRVGKGAGRRQDRQQRRGAAALPEERSRHRGIDPYLGYFHQLDARTDVVNVYDPIVDDMVEKTISIPAGSATRFSASSRILSRRFSPSFAAS